jgi:hypothetical protein
MFKWKVYFYQNINGKEKKVEKEFNNPNEYYDFINSNPEFNYNNLLSFGDLDNYLENFFNSRFALEPVYETENTWNNLLPEWVNLDKYEEEVRKIDEEKKRQKEEKNLLEKSLEKLKGFLEKFKKEWKDDLVKKVKEDIKKVEEKLKKLVK